MDNYLTIKEVAEKWNLTTRRVQKMCSDGLIPGVIRFGRAWAIPAVYSDRLDPLARSFRPSVTEL